MARTFVGEDRDVGEGCVDIDMLSFVPCDAMESSICVSKTVIQVSSCLSSAPARSHACSQRRNGQMLTGVGQLGVDGDGVQFVRLVLSR